MDMKRTIIMSDKDKVIIIVNDQDRMNMKETIIVVISGQDKMKIMKIMDRSDQNIVDITIVNLLRKDTVIEGLIMLVRS